MEVSGQIHATADLNLEKETKIPIKCETNWAQFWIIREKKPMIFVGNRNNIMRLYTF